MHRHGLFDRKFQEISSSHTVFQLLMKSVSYYHSISGYYAQPGIRTRSKCCDHCYLFSKGYRYSRNSCYCNLCEEDIRQLTPTLLQRFLTAAGCNSLQDFKEEEDDLDRWLGYSMFYCKRVKRWSENYSIPIFIFDFLFTWLDDCLSVQKTE